MLAMDYVFHWRHVSDRDGSASRRMLASTLDIPTATAEVTWPGYESRYEVTFLRREWLKWAWPGGYPIYYITADGGILSADAANENVDRTLDPDDPEFFIVAQEVNWENNFLYCDHTGELIQAAYGD